MSCCCLPPVPLANPTLSNRHSEKKQKSTHPGVVTRPTPLPSPKLRRSSRPAPVALLSLSLSHLFDSSTPPVVCEEGGPLSRRFYCDG